MAIIWVCYGYPVVGVVDLMLSRSRREADGYPHSMRDNRRQEARDLSCGVSHLDDTVTLTNDGAKIQ